MKAMVCNIIISSISTSSDKSLRFRAATPELTDIEAVAFMGLRGINIRALLEPSDYEAEGKIEVKSDLETKTPSQRLRAIMFVEFKEKRLNTLFEVYYAREMEKICEERKSKLPDR